MRGWWLPRVIVRARIIKGGWGVKAVSLHNHLTQSEKCKWEQNQPVVTKIRKWLKKGWGGLMRKEPQENFGSSLALFIKQHLRTVVHCILTNTLLKINKGNQNTPINKMSIKCKLLLCGDMHRLSSWFKEARLFPVGYKSVSHNTQYHSLSHFSHYQWRRMLLADLGVLSGKQ